MDAHAPGDGGDEYGRCDLKEDLAAVEQVGVAVLEVGVGEDAVDEQQYSAGIDEPVQVAPHGAGHAGSDQRTDQDDHDQIERGGSGGVELGLQVGVQRPEDIRDAEAWGLEEEQDGRMREREHDGEVGRPAMEGEDVDFSVGPESDGAVAQRHQHAQQQVHGDGADGSEAEVGAEIEESHQDVCSLAEVQKELGGAVAEEDAGYSERDEGCGEGCQRQAEVEALLGAGGVRCCGAQQGLDADPKVVGRGEQGDHACWSRAGVIAGEEDKQVGEEQGAMGVPGGGVLIGGELRGETPAGVERRTGGGGEGNAGQQREDQELEVVAMGGMGGFVGEGDFERWHGDAGFREELLGDEEAGAEDADDREQRAAAAMEVDLVAADGALGWLAAVAVALGAERGRGGADEGGCDPEDHESRGGNAGKGYVFGGGVVFSAKIGGDEGSEGQQPGKDAGGEGGSEEQALSAAGVARAVA